VMIGAPYAPEYAYPAANWNAHAGHGFAWVTPEGVPEATKRLLDRRGPAEPFIYVFAPESVVGPEVLETLSRYGYVQRIPGETPQEMAVRWAGFKDIGRKIGWWFGESIRSVGWGISESGHNMIVANPADWRACVPSGVLSHMGKHAPLLLTNEDGTLPEVTAGFLEVIRPTRMHPSVQTFNFAWIAGEGVPEATQRDVSERLTVPPRQTQRP